MRAQVESQRAQAISGLEMAKAQIIQGATEADRSRALQEYLALLQSQSSYRPTVSQPIVQPQSVTQLTQKPYEDVPYSSLLSNGGGYSPYAAAGYGLSAGGNVSLEKSQEKLYQGGWTG